MNCALAFRAPTQSICRSPQSRGRRLLFRGEIWRRHRLASLPSRGPGSSRAKSFYNRRGGRGDSKKNVPPYVIYGFALPAASVAAAATYAYYRCLDSVPYTNRRRFIATSSQWEENIGHDQYKALLKQFQGEVLPKDHRATVTVQRVGGRIAAAAQICLREWNSTIPRSPTSPYTYTVVRSPEANAFVLPGNHVFVLTGLFRYAHNEDELASVLGHEVAHNLARHAGERMSESLLMGILSRLTLLIDPSGVLFSILLPVQTLLVQLPHSREHEVEADRIGVILAGEACYDPRSAKRVFSRMKEDAANRNGGNTTPPEFISTHPGYDTRLDFFDQWMPEALERFGKDGGNKCKAIREEMKRARRLAAEMH
ncbi:hypothetical protein ACHAWF_006622 [Thalassiosira exigua]